MSRQPRSPNRQFSREGFQPLTHARSNSWERDNMASSHTMGTGDVTIDIPLTQIQTNKSTGARKAGVLSPQATTNAQKNDLSVISEKQSNTQNPFHRYSDSEGFQGRRRRIQEKGVTNSDSTDGSLNAMGKIYDKIYNFSVITRYMFYVAPLALAIAVPIVIGATTVAQNATIGGVRIVWFFSWIEVVWVSLWVSKLFAQFLPYLFQFIVGVVSSGTRKYALVITALEIPLSLVFWSICSLTTFVPLMTLNPDQASSALKPWESIVKNILFACLFSTLVLLGEKLLIQLLSISYHRKQFDDKITESKRNIFLVGLLYDASRSLFPAYCPEFAEEDYIMTDVLDLGLGLGSRDAKGGHSRSGSATPMRLIQNAARIGDKVTAAFGNVAQEITGKQVFNPTSAHSIVIQALERKKACDALARRLWLSFVLEGHDALYLDDIRDVLGSARETEADEAFACLDGDGNGDISLEEMILRIGEIGRERKSIANSMRDVDQAINVLDNLLCTVVFIMVVFIFVAWLNTNFTTTLATTGTALLSLSFVFAATCQEVLGSCIFLFVKHPYDVGDRVDITDKSYVVERISLLYTIFRCVNNHKRTQVPNIVLNSNWIDNVSRSKAMREQLLLYISFDTTLDDIELLRKEMQKFVLDKDNARDFQPEIDVEVTGIAEMNKLELKVEIRHKSNWSNEAVRATRRSKFMCALVLALKKVPIYAPGGGGAAAGDKANPTYSVAISHDEAEQNKGVFSRAKEEARMIPTADLEKVDSAKSTAVQTTKSNDNQAKDRAQAVNQAVQIGGLTQRSITDDAENTFIQSPQSPRAPQAAADRQRSNDVEEVRTILRRESTSTGRRRAYQQDALSPTTSTKSGTGKGSSAPAISSFPTIAEPGLNPGPVVSNQGIFGTQNIAPPPIPPQAASRLTANAAADQQPSQRVSYYEDNNNGAFSQGSTNNTYAPAPLYTQFPITNQPHPPRKASLVSPEEQEGRARADSATLRKPVPGIGEMKEYLHGQGGPASQR